MIRFFVLFVVLQAALFGLELTPVAQTWFVEPWTVALAHLSTNLVTLFDHNVVASGRIIRSTTNGFAVSIEAGFVPSDEPEDEVVEAEEEDEEIEEAEDTAAVAEEESRQAPQQPREGDGKRRRRRRGGRGRNRDRGPRPEGADPSAPVAEAGSVAAEAGETDQGSTDDGHGHDDNGHTNGNDGQGQNGDSGRRRRRRRGRRGGRGRDDAQPAPSFNSDADRFGAPDEIDTTPTSTPLHAPGAPSAPLWSLQDDIPDTTPKEEAPKPAKKGWWQRAFRS